MNYRSFFPYLISAAVLCAGCGSENSTTLNSGSASSNFSSSSAVDSSTSSSRLLANLRILAALLAEKAGQSTPTVTPRTHLDRQVNLQIPGPGGGSATLTGDFNVGPDANNPATSEINVTLDNFTFLDGLIVNGGTVKATTVLYGTETAAHGKLTLDAQNVAFSGTGTGTHNFKIEIDLVNSKPINTVLTYDGQRRELGFFVKIANYSTTPDDQVFVCLYAKSDDLSHYNYLAEPDAESLTEFDDQPGQFLPRNAQGGFVGSEKYSFPLSQMSKVGDKTRGMFVPRNNLVSGRIFLSFGRKLQGIGIISPYNNSAGQPISQAASATGSLQQGNATVNLSGIDATQSLAVNEPVTYTLGGNNYSTRIASIPSPTQVVLQSVPAASGSTTLNFQPSPQDFADAKRVLGTPSATGGADYLVTYDFVELSATTDTSAPDPFFTLFANTTAIDFFSVGLGMTVDFAGLPPTDGKAALAPSDKTVGFGTSAASIKSGVSQRSQILARFNNTDQNPVTTPVEFQNFVTSTPQGNSNIVIGQAADVPANIIRVLGPPPVVSLNPTGALNRYLESAIASQWPTFCSNAVNLTGANAIFYPLVTPSFTYQGRTPGSSSTLNLNCTQAAGSNSGAGDNYSLPIPTTRMVFECDDTQNPGPSPNNYINGGTDAHKRLASLVLSSLARGVFPNVADWSNNSKFYSDPNKRYNFFSRVMHEFALDGIVYGFAYDDVFGQDSTIAAPVGLSRGGKVPGSLKGNVVDVLLTIPNFTAPPPPAVPKAPGVPLKVQAVLDQGSQKPVSPQGCVLHLTPADGSADITSELDANGAATVSGLLADTDYYAWIAPGTSNGNDWTISYSAFGHYDGTTGGNWNSSYGTNTPGLIRVRFGRLEPGVGSALDPEPNPLSPPAPGKSTFPPLTPGSGQATWGN